MIGQSVIALWGPGRHLLANLQESSHPWRMQLSQGATRLHFDFRFRQGRQLHVWRFGVFLFRRSPVFICGDRYGASEGPRLDIGECSADVMVGFEIYPQTFETSKPLIFGLHRMEVGSDLTSQHGQL
jgi:hypothetical protein